jgi:hypothetical protein
MTLKELIHFLNAQPTAEYRTVRSTHVFDFPALNLEVRIHPFAPESEPLKGASLYEGDVDVETRARAKGWLENRWFAFIAEQITHRIKVLDDLFGDK